MAADSHAETSPLDIANGLVIRPLERFEYFFQKFWFHSYTVIRYGYFKLAVNRYRQKVSLLPLVVFARLPETI